MGHDKSVDVCNDWHGSQGDKVTFTNNSGNDCTIDQDGDVWPFKDGPPLPATGSCPNGGTIVTHLKNPLANGPYTYNVNGCITQIPKTVTVP